jgi:hypothetical protein
VELDRCVAKMKTKKASGEHQMVAELLKYGGSKLCKMVYEVVKKMWNIAGDAEWGHEADDWPAKWKV